MTAISTAPEMLEKIRQQFNEAPYPNIPLDQSPKGETGYLYSHCLVTGFYRKTQQIVSTQDKLILDVGCGSGYKSLLLAEANPGAQIVGIDISEASIDLAQKRLAHYGFDNAKFHVMGVEELSQLGQKFDYINCDEVLYLLTDPIAGLKAMGSVLKETGVMRVNFHSTLQRHLYHQAQEFAQMVGIMDEPKETSMQLFREFMKALRPAATVKAQTWRPAYEKEDSLVLANHLLRGDKGWTIPEFFAALDQAGLGFISMVEWERWNLLTLFEDLEEVPLSIAMSLADASAEEQLHMYELLNSGFNRLLDLWCGHPSSEATFVPLEDWTPEQWRQSSIALHPQVATEQLQENLTKAVTTMTVTDLNVICDKSLTPVLVNGMFASCLLTLFKGPRLFSDLMAQWQQIQPVNLLSLTPITLEEAQEAIQSEIQRLVELGYMMAELPLTGERDLLG
jgi:2-polyprenyl-3-methyl-5-hydroxy-6-metoxy-1,4-benzoquinol methylase